jgi:hypothetical protein
MAGISIYGSQLRIWNMLNQSCFIEQWNIQILLQRHLNHDSLDVKGTWLRPRLPIKSAFCSIHLLSRSLLFVVAVTLLSVRRINYSDIFTSLTSVWGSKLAILLVIHSFFYSFILSYSSLASPHIVHYLETGKM